MLEIEMAYVGYVHSLRYGACGDELHESAIAVEKDMKGAYAQIDACLPW